MALNYRRHDNEPYPFEVWFNYDAELIESIKKRIPFVERSYDRELQHWWFTEVAFEHVCNEYCYLESLHYRKPIITEDEKEVVIERQENADGFDLKIAQSWFANGYKPMLVHQKLLGEKRPNGYGLFYECGVGKELKNDTVIPAPQGDKTIGKITVGDVIFDDKGNKTNVVGVYPQGIKQEYKITFTDGRTVICGENHLWNVEHYSFRNPIKKQYKGREIISWHITHTMSTAELLHQYKTYNTILTSPVYYDDQPIECDPYIVGAMIGNGCTTIPQLTISHKDECVPNIIAQKLRCSVHKQRGKNFSYTFSTNEHRPNGTLVHIRTDILPKELINKLSHEKRIPQQYIQNSISVRKELLAGLLDTDGHIYLNKDKAGSERNGISYSTTSRQLADDIQTLVNSLGYRCSISVFNKKENRSIYNLHLAISKENAKDLTKTKQNIIEKWSDKRRRYDDCITIKKVEKLNACSEMTCIAVDSPSHLFMCGKYIPTHNTSSAICEFYRRRHEGRAHRMIVIVFRASLTINWKEDVKKLFDYEIDIVDGEMKLRAKKIAESESLIVVTPFTTLGDEPSLNEITRHFDMLVADEVHTFVSDRKTSIKADGTKGKTRYWGLSQLCKAIPNRLALTGTPQPNKAINAYTPLMVCAPDKFPSKYNFTKRYAELDKWGKPKAYKNLNELKSYLAYYGMIALKKDYCDIPPKTEINLYCQMGSKTEKVLKEAISIQEGNGQFDRMSLDDYYIKIHQLIACPSVYHEFKSDKVGVLKDYIDNDIPSDEQIIVFASFKGAVKEIIETLGRDLCACMIGGMTAKSESIEYNDFKTGRKQILVATIQKMGVGFNLQNARHIFMYDTAMTGADYEQGASRAWRTGQTNEVIIYNILMDIPFDMNRHGIINEQRKLWEKMSDDNYTMDSQQKIKLLSQIMKGQKKPIR